MIALVATGLFLAAGVLGGQERSPDSSIAVRDTRGSARLLRQRGAASTTDPHEGGRYPLGRVRLEGPLEEVVFDQGRHGRTRIAVPLLAGERRELEVPFAHRPLDAAAAPEATIVRGAGAARFEGWTARDARVPAELRARGRPLPAPPAAGAAPATWLVVIAAAALTLGARRRPRAAWAAGAAGAALACGVQAARPAPPSATVRVLEGRVHEVGAPGSWVALVVGAGRLEGLPPGVLRVESAPESAPLEWRIEAEEADPGATPRTSVLGRGATLAAWLPLDPGARALAPELNTWGDLEAVWTRSAGGTWRAHGAWPLGEALGPALESAREIELGHPRGSGPTDSAPPGWAAARLPQGPGVLVARLAPGTWAGEGGGPRPRATWLRRVGP